MYTADYENLPIFISSFAIIAALINIRSLLLIRLTTIIFALGSGQIYLSVISYIIFLFIEFGYKFRFYILKKHAIFLCITFSIIFFISLFNEINSKSIIEFFQLCLYVLIFIFTLNFINSEKRFFILLKAMFYGATINAIISFLISFSNLDSNFITTGNNEGSFFLLILGFIPSYCLFISKKNPLYLITTFLNIYILYISTARASLSISFLIILISAFYYFNKEMKALFFSSLSILTIFYYEKIFNFDFLQQNLRNYSFIERLYLNAEGIKYWQQSPYIGWGWGSMTKLASQIDIPMDPDIGIKVIHPHFHSTYIQLIVELGIFGILFSTLISYFCIKNAFKKDIFEDSLLISSYVRFSSIAIFFSGFTEAYIYGAYRFLPVIFLLSLFTVIFNKNFYIKRIE